MKHLLLLHGALGSKDQFTALAAVLSKEYQVHPIDLPGHGGTEVTGAFSIAAFAEAVINYLDKNKIDAAAIFGYSMGGYVALYMAQQHPGKVERVVTLATKFEWNEEIALKEAKMLDPVIMEQKIPAFTQRLSQRHAPVDWKMVVANTKAMMLALGRENTLQLEDYPQINTPALLLLGDRDKMVTVEETLAVYRQLPVAQLGILPATPHPFEQVNVDVLGKIIDRFLHHPMP